MSARRKIGCVPKHLDKGSALCRQRRSSIGSTSDAKEEDRRLDRRVNEESVAGTTGMRDASNEKKRRLDRRDEPKNKKLLPGRQEPMRRLDRRVSERVNELKKSVDRIDTRRRLDRRVKKEEE